MMSLGIRTALSKPLDPVVVEDVERHDAALDLANDGAVDLAILDPYRPTLDEGLKFCKTLKGFRSAPYVLAFCDVGDKRDLMYCLLAGIDSVISSQEHPERLASAVESTLRGKREWILGTPGDQQKADIKGLADLTPRELDVLWMVRKRYTNRQIGSSLSISPNTVKNHVAAILRKLGIQRRFALFSDVPHRW